jgi:hypothetical protein
MNEFGSLFSEATFVSLLSFTAAVVLVRVILRWNRRDGRRLSPELPSKGARRPLRAKKVVQG